MRQREPAICLGVTDYSETSQVAHFLTRGAGVVRLLAKGTKRPKSKSGGALDLFSEGELLFLSGRGESLGTLLEFTEGVAHNDLRKESAALDAALYMVEAAGRLLASGDPHPEVFDLLHNSLRRLGQSGAPRPAVLAYFLWRLLRHAGLLGELRACVSCGRRLEGEDLGAKAGLYFSSSMGGLLCGECEGPAVEKYRLGGLEVAAIAALSAAEAGQRTALPAPPAEAAIRLLAYHIAHQTGKPLRMARHYKARG
jgi:DNA repair protein RecO (recombination protein O)